MNELRNLVQTYGKVAINSMTKYPSILTLHKLAQDGRTLLNDMTTKIDDNVTLFSTEKLDGCNVRLIFYRGQFLIGSRDNMLHFGGDLYYQSEYDIVDSLYDMLPIAKIADSIAASIYGNHLVVVYGEFYRGKALPKGKNYGRETHGFRVFDICAFKEGDLDEILKMKPVQISRWREGEGEGGMYYGQPFLSYNVMGVFCEVFGFQQVPMVPFFMHGTSHEEVLSAMRQALPKSNAALSDDATKIPEGIVVRTSTRSRIFKLRFENYEKTILKNK